MAHCEPVARRQAGGSLVRFHKSLASDRETCTDLEASRPWGDSPCTKWSFLVSLYGRRTTPITRASTRSSLESSLRRQHICYGDCRTATWVWRAVLSPWAAASSTTIEQLQENVFGIECPSLTQTAVEQLRAQPPGTQEGDLQLDALQNVLGTMWMIVVAAVVYARPLVLKGPAASQRADGRDPTTSHPACVDLTQSGAAAACSTTKS